jgi:hypothetical protein
LIVSPDVGTLRSVAFGREGVTAAEREGRLAITLDHDAALNFPKAFRAPTPQANAGIGENQDE